MMSNLWWSFRKWLGKQPVWFESLIYALLFTGSMAGFTGSLTVAVLLTNAWISPWPLAIWLGVVVLGTVWFVFYGYTSSDRERW
jgi:hypothetical protein